MRWSRGLVLVAALAGLLALGGCETSTKLGSLVSGSKAPEGTTGALPAPDDAPPAAGAEGEPPSTGSVGGAAPPGAGAPEPALLGKDPKDDLNLGKQHYRAGNFGLAERHFRRAVELHPNDGEAWVGLAAAYDKLRRFDLADRAYQQAIGILGRMPSILNNQGYSYMLRGDFRRSRAILLEAQVKDPDNPYIQNNIELLNKSQAAGRGIR
jgi:tetratricopeptide (TPR) repeat protein